MIIVGEALAELRRLPGESVQTCVTSPPYWGLRDYGCEGQIGLEPTPGEYIAHLVELFEEVRRVLRSDGTLWLNLGDSYATGGGHVGDAPGGKGQGDKFNDAWSSGYHAAGTHGPQTITLNDRQKIYKGRGAHGFDPKRAKHPGIGHAVIGDDLTGYRPVTQGWTQPNRMPLPGLKPKDLIGIPWRVAFALQDAGWYLRSDIIWHKPNPMPESVRDRPTKSHEYLFLLAKQPHYYYDSEAIKEPCQEALREGRNAYRGQAAMRDRGPDKRWTREFQGKLADTAPQSAGRRILLNVKAAREAGGAHDAPFGLTRNKRDVWTVATKPYRGAHFATFPPKLIEPCILAGSRPDDLVLDPFAGAGTTGLVAAQLGRRFLGIELNPGYADLAAERLAAA